MKLTTQELDTFKNLAKTEVGMFLVDYLKRVQDHIHDSRSWKVGDTKESATQAARMIQELVIDKIHAGTSVKAVLNQHE